MNLTTRFLRPVKVAGLVRFLVKVSSLWGSTLESQNCVSLLDYLGLPLGARMVVGKKERRGKWKKLKEKARVCRLQSVHACKSAAGCEICGRSK